MIGNRGRWAAAVLVLLTSLTPTRRLAAQWSSVAFGVAEGDTRNTLLLLAGMSASPKALGIQPVLALQGYWLGYDVGSTRTNVNAIRPGAGLGYHYNGGSLDGTVGYQFSSGTNSGAPVAGTAVGRGVDLAGDWEYWGTGGPLGYQALADYNFGGDSFWGRGRVTTRVSQHGPSQMRVGGEVAYDEAPGYNAWQPGAVLEWHFAHGQILGLGAGGKFQNTGGNGAFFRVEGLLPITR
jgi:hypothetical protein